MKKIILIIFLFFGIVNMVSAQEFYYSDYSEFSDYSDEEVLESELIDVETETRYKWYKWNKVGEYLREFDNHQNYQFIDKDNYKLSDYSEWSNEFPAMYDSRILEENLTFKFRDPKPVRYIHLSNFNGNNGDLNISEIEVKINYTKVDFNYYCEGCSDDFNTYIKNEVIKEDLSFVRNDGYIRIDLGDYYNITDILITVSLAETTTNNESFNIKINNSPNINDRVYFYYQYINPKVVQSINSITSTNIYPFDFEEMSPEYTDYQIVSQIPATAQFRQKESIHQYRYRDKLYYYYNTTKSYLDDYYVNYDGYIKDTNLFKNYYRYRTREKIYIESDNNPIEELVNDIKSGDNIPVKKELIEIKSVDNHKKEEINKEVKKEIKKEQTNREVSTDKSTNNLINEAQEYVKSNVLNIDKNNSTSIDTITIISIVVVGIVLITLVLYFLRKMSIKR